MLRVTHRRPGPPPAGCLHALAPLQDDRAVLAYESAGTVAVTCLQAGGAASPLHVVQGPSSRRGPVADVVALAWAPSAARLAVAGRGRVDCYSWRGGPPGGPPGQLAHDGSCDTPDSCALGACGRGDAQSDAAARLCLLVPCPCLAGVSLTRLPAPAAVSWTADGDGLLVCSDDATVSLWQARGDCGAVTPSSEALFDTATGRPDVLDVVWRTTLDTPQARPFGRCLAHCGTHSLSAIPISGHCCRGAPPGRLGGELRAGGSPHHGVRPQHAPVLGAAASHAAAAPNARAGRRVAARRSCFCPGAAHFLQ